MLTDTTEKRENAQMLDKVYLVCHNKEKILGEIFMVKSKTVYFCTECGSETLKWQGRCPSCGAWNALEERSERASASGKGAKFNTASTCKPKGIFELDSCREIRFSTGIGELNRVLGGGIVEGSLVLVSGAPGIGKSTLLLQICEALCKERTVLYVSGEESERQLKLRAQRLNVVPEKLYILSETRLESALECVEQLKPDVLIIDSVQTMYLDENDSAPGSVSQVKDCTMSLMQLSKQQGISVFVVGHINKDGNIAGPKVLEHMVDCVLYFEGDPNTSYRLLRAAKNRFGSTNEIGVFEMLDTGLKEVPNPSKMLLKGRPEGASGTCVACVMEGTRPVLAEVQALVSRTSFNVPRRTADGFDFNRAALLLAVTEKRANMKLSQFDTYINVIGGLQLDEPAADLPVVLAIASSYRDRPIPADLVAIGEVGLAGEIRAVSHMGQRLQEVVRLGFKKCVIPQFSAEKVEIPAGLVVYQVKNLVEAIEVAL